MKTSSKKATPSFKKTLFWDVDVKNMDFDSHAQSIIGRVLDFGDISDFKKIKEYYGLRTIKLVAKKHSFPSVKHLPLWELVLKLPRGTLSCTRKHLPQIPGTFLMS